MGLASVRRGFAVWSPTAGTARLPTSASKGTGRRTHGRDWAVLRTTVTVGAAEVEAILSRERRIIVGQPHDGCHEARRDADAERIGAPLRLSVKDGSSTDSPLDAA